MDIFMDIESTCMVWADLTLFVVAFWRKVSSRKCVSVASGLSL
jgi:hypothetical protein